MLKQLDQIKKLQDQLEVLGEVPQVREFLEINKMISSLRSSVRNGIVKIIKVIKRERLKLSL